MVSRMWPTVLGHRPGRPVRVPRSLCPEDLAQNAPRTVLGLAGRMLIETAQRVNAQLIVLAGRGGGAMPLGTVSQYVLRRAPCPVLVVPEASRDA